MRMMNTIKMTMLALLMWGHANTGHAMGETVKDTVRVSCRAENAKVSLSPQTCALFVDRLRAANPTQDYTLIKSGVADITLVMQQANARMMTALIETANGIGEPLGMAQRGAAISDKTRAGFFDRLINQSL